MQTTQTTQAENETRNNLELSPALYLIKKYEGFSSKPYLCPAGVWTIGYGNTKYLNGSPVRKNDPEISKQEAEELLENTVKEEFLPGLLELSPHLKNHHFKLNALLSFCYNLGLGAYSKSTLRKKVDAKQWDDAAEQFMRWVNAGGKKLNGLVKRRAEEASVFMR